MKEQKQQKSNNDKEIKIIEKMMNNNVVVRGTVVSAPVYSHEVLGEKFYEMVIGIKRMSGVEDRVPVLVSERMGRNVGM